jgi:hypothetical protein
MCKLGVFAKTGFYAFLPNGDNLAGNSQGTPKFVGDGQGVKQAGYLLGRFLRTEICTGHGVN